MPLPLAALRAITYELYLDDNKLPEPEKQRLIALTALNHLSSLAALRKHLSVAKAYASGHGGSHPIEADIGMEEFDAGMFAISELEGCIADAAFIAVEEMFTAFTEPPKKKSV